MVIFYYATEHGTNNLAGSEISSIVWFNIDIWFLRPKLGSFCTWCPVSGIWRVIPWMSILFQCNFYVQKRMKIRSLPSLARFCSFPVFPPVSGQGLLHASVLSWIYVCEELWRHICLLLSKALHSLTSMFLRMLLFLFIPLLAKCLLPFPPLIYFMFHSRFEAQFKWVFSYLWRMCSW